MATEITGINLADLYKKFGENLDTSRTAQAGREQTATQALQEALNLYGPKYMQGQEKTALAAAGQSAVGRGLAGTTVPVAASARIKARFNDLRIQGRERALANLAQFAGSYRDPTAVTPATLAHLATGGFAGLLDVAKTNLAMQGGGSAPSAGLPTYGPFAGYSGGGGGGGGSSAPGFGDYSIPDIFGGGGGGGIGVYGGGGSAISGGQGLAEYGQVEYAPNWGVPATTTTTPTPTASTQTNPWASQGLIWREEPGKGWGLWPI